MDQLSFIMLFFESHRDEEFDSYDVEETIRHAWIDMTGEKFRDPGRRLRQLREQGYITSETKNSILYFRFSKPYHGGG